MSDIKPALEKKILNNLQKRFDYGTSRFQNLENISYYMSGSYSFIDITELIYDSLIIISEQTNDEEARELANQTLSFVNEKLGLE